jgi:hypothetical protein
MSRWEVAMDRKRGVVRTLILEVKIAKSRIKKIRVLTGQQIFALHSCGHRSKSELLLHN